MPRCFAKGCPGTSDAEYVERYRDMCEIDPARGCWLYQGFIHPSTGYGDVSYRGENMRTHRAMYLAAKGEIPRGLFVLHTCDVRRCCNPDHLWLGTISDNKQDELAKGRNYEANRTECPHGHAYTPENTSTDKRGWRHCRTCQKAKEKNPSYIAWRREYQKKRRALMREQRGQLRRTGEL